MCYLVDNKLDRRSTEAGCQGLPRNPVTASGPQAVNHVVTDTEETGRTPIFDAAEKDRTDVAEFHAASSGNHSDFGAVC